MTDSWLQEAEACEDRGLRGKVAIVTGAGAEDDGVTNGRAAAILLGRSGTRVVCVGRRAQPVRRTAEMIISQDGEAISVTADVSNESDCERVVAEALDSFGRLDFVDNNVGVGMSGTVVSTPIGQWRDNWQTNVESMILMAKFAIPAMTQTAGKGSIVNIGSLRAIRPFDFAPYSVTKGAVMSLTQAMAVDHALDGIRVN